TTNATVSTLDITAIAAEPKQAVTVADAFADELISSLNEKDQDRLNKSRDTTINRLSALQNQIDSLDAQIAAQPGNAIVTAQRDSTVNQYRLVYENFQQLAALSADTGRLSTLETGQALPISADEYRARLTRGELGENNVQIGNSSAVDTTAAADSGDTLK